MAQCSAAATLGQAHIVHIGVLGRQLPRNSTCVILAAVIGDGYVVAVRHVLSQVLLELGDVCMQRGCFVQHRYNNLHKRIVYRPVLRRTSTLGRPGAGKRLWYGCYFHGC